MYFLYSLGGVTFNKCWITLSILNCYSPNFQGFILMKNAINNQVGMLGDMFLWLVANLKQGVIYFIKQACGNDKRAGVYVVWPLDFQIQKKNSFRGNFMRKYGRLIPQVYTPGWFVWGECLFYEVNDPLLQVCYKPWKHVAKHAHLVI